MVKVMITRREIKQMTNLKPAMTTAGLEIYAEIIFPRKHPFKYPQIRAGLLVLLGRHQFHNEWQFPDGGLRCEIFHINGKTIVHSYEHKLTAVVKRWRA